MNTTHPDSIEAFDAVIQENRRVLVDFYKDNCPGCKMLDASLAKITDPSFEGVVLVKAKLEILGEDFFKGLGLRQTPTLIAYVDGKEASRLPGFSPPAKIESFMSEALDLAK